MNAAPAKAERPLVFAPGLRLARILWRVLPMLAWIGVGLLTARLFGANDTAMEQVLLVAAALLGYRVAAAMLREALSPDRPWLRLVPMSDLRAHRLDTALRAVLFFVTMTSVGIHLVYTNGWNPGLADLLRVIRNAVIVFAGFVMLATTGVVGWLRTRSGESVPATVARFTGRVGFPVAFVTVLVFAAARGAGYFPLSEWLLRNSAWSLLKLLAVVLVYRWLTRSLYRTVHFYAAAEPGEGDVVIDESEANPYALGVVRITTGILKLVLVVFTTIWLLRTWSLSLPILAEILAVGIPGDDHLTWGHLFGGFLKIVVVLWVGWLIRSVLTYFVFPHSAIGVGGRYAILAVMRYTIVAIAIVLGLAAFGVDTGSLGWFFGAAGVGLAFGLQDVIGNFVSGLIMLVERPIRVGDVVQIGTSMGTVEEIKMRGTTLRTFDNTTLLIPNSQMLGERVTNMTHGLGHSRLKIPLMVPHDADPRQVESILLTAAHANEDVLEDPKPFVWFSEFSPSSLDFTLICFTAQLRGRFGIASRLRFAIMDSLKEAGIEIPFPQQDLHIRSAPPGAEPGPPTG